MYYIKQITKDYILGYYTSPKTGSAQRALSALRAFQLCFSSNYFVDLKLWCEDTPTVDPPLLPPSLIITN